MIAFDKVTKSYDKAVLNCLSLPIAEGKFNALLGESGRGKTTVLRLIGGLERAQSGKVAIDGKIGYLFQEPRLVPTLTALENVRLVQTEHTDGIEAFLALKLCCAEHLQDKFPSEMSGGERQRVALARLIAYGGDVLLLDEPFSALDDGTKQTVFENLRPLFSGKTVIMVTHSEKDAQVADNIMRI